MKFNKRNFFKRLGLGLLSLILILVLATLSLRLPSVQNFVKGKVIHFVQDKIGTPISLEHVYVNFPNGLELQNLYVEGQNRDTILLVKNLNVGLAIPKLLDNQAQFTSIELNGLVAFVKRDNNGNFNFDYIVDAFGTTEEKSSKPFIINLDKIDLRNIRLNYSDAITQYQTQVIFKALKTRFKNFDLQENDYALGDLYMEGLRLKLKQDILQEASKKVEKKVDSLSAQSPLKLDLNGIELVDFDIDYKDEITKTYVKVKFDELLSEIKRLDVEKSSFVLDDFVLKNAKIKADLFLASEDSETKNSETNPTNPLHLAVNDFDLENINVLYNNTATTPQKKGIDFNHLDIKNLNFSVSDFEMKDSEIKGEINKGNFEEKSGLVLQKLQTDFEYTQKNIRLKNFLLETPNSLLKNRFEISYHSLEDLTKNPGMAQLDLNLEKSKIGFEDIQILAPEVSNQKIFKNYPNASLALNAKVNGLVDDLNIEELSASGLDDFQLKANGSIKNATKPENLSYNVNLIRLHAQEKTLRRVLPAEALPNNLSLPEKITTKGKLKGNTEQVDTELNINSTDGDALLAGIINWGKSETYDLDLETTNLNLGKIIQNPDLGKMSGAIKVEGNGFDLTSATAKISGNIEHFFYNQYNYSQIELKGNIENSRFNLNLFSNDPAARLNLAVSGVYNDKNPQAKIDGVINKLDFNKLNFYDEALIIAGRVSGSFENLNPDELNGNLYLRDFAVSDTQNVYPIQDIQILAKNTSDFNLLQLNSSFADAKLEGKYRVSQIFQALEKTLNQYYPFFKNSKGLENIDPHQFFHFSVEIKNDNLLKNLIPNLNSFEPISISGDFNADFQKIILNAEIPQVDYAGNEINNANLNIDNVNQALVFQVKWDELKSGRFKILNSSLEGSVKDQQILYSFSSKDQNQNIAYAIDGSAQRLDEVFQLSLRPGQLVLNGENWHVEHDNQITVHPEGINAQNFKLSHGNSFLSLESSGSSPFSPLRLDIEDFKLETLTALAQQDTLLAKGILNGSFELKNLMKSPQVNGNLKVDSLQVFNAPLGHLDVNLNQRSAEHINTQIELKGNGNQVNLDGNYNLVNDDLNFELLIDRLNMTSIQGFTAQQIKEAEGFLSGNLEIFGKSDSPSIHGKLKFNDVGMFVTTLGTKFQGMNDELLFQPKGIEVNQFSIFDKDKNQMLLDGTIFTQKYQDFSFDLRLTAKDFKIVDAEKNSENLVGGVLSVDTDLAIKGDLDLPKIGGNISIDKPTDFSFTIPQSSPSLKKREGVVEFIDQDQVVLNQSLKKDSVDRTSRIKGLDVAVDIHVKKEAKLSIIVDQATGDFIQLQGEAELSGGIDPSGKTSLTGIYEVNEGAYQLNINLLQRKFNIQKGSTITWAGDPLSANIDITAVYKTETAPIDLLEQQISGLSGASLNIYKQKIPFNTLLMMKGDLMKPEISFDINVDGNNAGVATEVIDNTKTKLSLIRNDSNEMNKQVFALLLLNRFIGENPFQSNSGLSPESMARQSVSRILSEQLNQLASDLIDGVDLNFDLESREDYTTGKKQNRTDLNVSLSKRLLDDRLKVTVGNKFGVEGEARTNEDMTNIAGEISLDYSLSRDGKYILRAYRKNEYQVALQGQVIETGLGFIITLEYNDFAEIFRKTKNPKSN